MWCVSAWPFKTFHNASPKLMNHILIPLVAVYLLWVRNSILPELQNHLCTFPDGLIIALAAGQEVWFLVLEVGVVEDQRFYSDGNQEQYVREHQTIIVLTKSEKENSSKM